MNNFLFPQIPENIPMGGEGGSEKHTPLDHRVLNYNAQY